MKKRNIKLANIIQVVLLVSLFLSFNSTNLTISAEVSTASHSDNLNLQAYDIHEPINIENDTSFVDYGFPGEGTPGDPYRIENYNITILVRYTQSLLHQSK